VKGRGHGLFESNVLKFTLVNQGEQRKRLVRIVSFDKDSNQGPPMHKFNFYWAIL